MSISIGQTSYSLLPDVAMPGQLSDSGFHRIRTYIASEVIQPGRLLTLAADGTSCQMAQETGDTQLVAGVLGISVLKTARQGTGISNDTTAPSTGKAYQPGEAVPVLSQGGIWAEWKGTTQVAFSVMNYYHSSTTATDRGKITDASISSSAGSEISVCPSGIQVGPASAGTGSLVLLEVNLPGAAV